MRFQQNLQLKLDNAYANYASDQRSNNTGKDYSHQKLRHKKFRSPNVDSPNIGLPSIVCHAHGSLPRMQRIAPMQLGTGIKHLVEVRGEALWSWRYFEIQEHEFCCHWSDRILWRSVIKLGTYTIKILLTRAFVSLIIWSMLCWSVYENSHVST
jgi:hypothetical protein